MIKQIKILSCSLELSFRALEALQIAQYRVYNFLKDNHWWVPLTNEEKPRLNFDSRFAKHYL